MSVAAQLLAEARRRSGLSQAELARRAGVARSVVNAYERGTRQPGADALAALLDAAGFELRLARRIDVHRNASVLKEVLDLAEALPHKPADALDCPRFRERVG